MSDDFWLGVRVTVAGAIVTLVFLLLGYFGGVQAEVLKDRILKTDRGIICDRPELIEDYTKVDTTDDPDEALALVTRGSAGVCGVFQISFYEKENWKYVNFQGSLARIVLINVTHIKTQEYGWLYRREPLPMYTLIPVSRGPTPQRPI